MTLKKVSGGDGLKTGQLNQFVDEFHGLASSRTGRRLDRNLMPGNPVWAINETGADLLMGEIAAIDSTPYLGNAAGMVTDNVVITLRETAAGDQGHWIVSANFIAEGDGGWVYTGGVCLARLEAGSSGSIPASLVEMIPGATYLEVGATGTGELLEDLGQAAASGPGEWGLIRFPVGGDGGGATVYPGDTVPLIVDAAGAVGVGVLYRRDDTIPGLKLRATKPGVKFEPAAAGMGIIWATSSPAIKPISDAVNAVGTLDEIAHADHVHKLFVGTGLSWTTVGSDRVLIASGGAAVPTGAIIMTGLSSAPSGYLSCDGAAVSRATYSDLFAAIGTTYGVGDGSTTFNVPPMSDKFARGNARGAGGGSDTHGHTLNGSMDNNNSFIMDHGQRTTGAPSATINVPADTGATPASDAHTHTVDGYSHAITPHGHTLGTMAAASANNVPAYVGFLFVIKI